MRQVGRKNKEQRKRNLEKEKVKQTWQIEAGYNVLATEIVHAALDDYIRAKREGREGAVLALQRWFRSEWCHQLCGIDGDVLVAAVEKKCEMLKSKRKKKIHNTNRPKKQNMANHISSKVAIPVVQIDVEGNIVATYGSIVEAAEKTGACKDAIGKCARHLKGYKTAGGYRWEYAEKRI